MFPFPKLEDRRLRKPDLSLDKIGGLSIISEADAVGSLLSTTIITVKLLLSFFVIGLLNLISGAGPGSGILLSI